MRKIKNIKAIASKYSVKPLGLISLGILVVLIVTTLREYISIWYVNLMLLIGSLFLLDYLIEKEVNKWIEKEMRVELRSK